MKGKPTRSADRFTRLNVRNSSCIMLYITQVDSAFLRVANQQILGGFFVELANFNHSGQIHLSIYLHAMLGVWRFFCCRGKYSRRERNRLVYIA